MGRWNPSESLSGEKYWRRNVVAASIHLLSSCPHKCIICKIILCIKYDCESFVWVFSLKAELSLNSTWEKVWKTFSEKVYHSLCRMFWIRHLIFYTSALAFDIAFITWMSAFPLQSKPIVSKEDDSQCLPLHSCSTKYYKATIHPGLQSTHVQIANQLIPFYSIMVTHINFTHTTNTIFFFISFAKWFQENNTSQTDIFTNIHLTL